MAGLVPAILVTPASTSECCSQPNHVDTRHKAGHDGLRWWHGLFAFG